MFSLLQYKTSFKNVLFRNPVYDLVQELLTGTMLRERFQTFMLLVFVFFILACANGQLTCEEKSTDDDPCVDPEDLEPTDGGLPASLSLGDGEDVVDTTALAGT